MTGSWWAHIPLAVFIAACFAAVPFWAHGISVEMATMIAAGIFPAVLVVYAMVMRGKL